MSRITRPDMSGDHGGIPPSGIAHGVKPKSGAGSFTIPQLDVNTGVDPGSPAPTKEGAVPDPVALTSKSADVIPSVAFVIVMLSLAGAGVAPESGTPFLADW